MWYRNTGKDSDVVLASRVALTRNLEDFPFSDKMTGQQAKQLVAALKEVYTAENGWTFTDLETAEPEEKRALAEQHVISRTLAEKKGAAGLFTNADSTVTVAVGGEDHVKIGAVAAGNDLKAAMDTAFAAEAELDEKYAIAFTEQFGYVTRNPAELGTGMKASVTLHLPVSTDTGWIARVAFRLAKDGISLRSMDGHALSTGVYLVSSRVTMGVDEEGIVKTVTDTAETLAAKERELRGRLTDEYRANLTENARRSYGTLMYAENLGTGELVGMYSKMRLASALGLVEIPLARIDEAMFGSLPHTLAASEHKDAQADLGMERAAYVKTVLKNAPLYQA